MKTLTHYLIILSAFILSAQYGSAQYIYIDSSYGVNGIATYSYGVHSAAYCADIQADGKIVMGQAGTYLDIGRYLSDGVIDSTFGINGFTLLDRFGFSTTIYAVKALGNGKILAAGQSGGNNFIAQLTAQGTIDSTFGTNGYTLMNTIGSSLPDLKVLSDGTIRYLHYNVNLSPFTYSPVVQKLSSNGVIDSIFGDITVSPIVAGAVGSYCAVDHNDRLIFAGQDSVSEYLVGAMLPNGTYDQSFGTHGFSIVTTTSTNPATSSATGSIDGLNIAPDNSLLISVGYGLVNPVFGAARVNSSGQQDASYGQGGVGIALVSTFMSTQQVAGMAMSDGTLLLACQAYFTSGPVQLNQGFLSALNPQGQSAYDFGGSLDSLVLQYDSANFTGVQNTVISSMYTIPGQNAFLLFSKSSNHGTALSKYDYSGFTAGIHDVSADIALQAYPDPARTICTISTQGDAGERYTAQLYDLAGHATGDAWSYTGPSTTFSVAPYTPGIYMLHISDSKGAQAIRKIIVEQ